MVLPRRIRPLLPAKLQKLTVERLLAYRKKALSLENTLATSDHGNLADALDPKYIWFKDDPRWEPMYNAVLAELHRKQTAK